MSFRGGIVQNPEKEKSAQRLLILFHLKMSWEISMQIKLSFLGAAQNVTGSRYLLESEDFKLLVDCGLYQERALRERNWDQFPVSPADIDAVLLTHAHLDHCGWLPRLVKKGFKGKVYATAATLDIARIVLMDSAKLQVEDAEFKKRRHKKEGRKGKFPAVPLYEPVDVEACQALFSPVKYKENREIFPGVEAVFQDAGHILGASMIRLKIDRDGQSRVILFSGDIGRWDKPILKDPTLIEEADYVLVESTYGDRLHQDNGEVKDELEEIINSTWKAGGNIVIPSFAVERAQEVLYHLNELLIEDKIPHLMAFLDSPMAVKVTKVFEKHPDLYDQEMLELIRQQESPFDISGLAMIRTADQSKAINHIKGTSIIIAGSGMCTGGRIKHHLVNNISRPESTILFVGYQAFGTLGRLIVDGKKEVRILGQKYPVRARIARINGFSGHADKAEILQWLAGLKRNPKQVFVVHGETKSANHFADHLRKNMNWNVSVPAYRDEFFLD